MSFNSCVNTLQLRDTLPLAEINARTAELLNINPEMDREVAYLQAVQDKLADLQVQEKSIVTNVRNAYVKQQKPAGHLTVFGKATPIDVKRPYNLRNQVADFFEQRPDGINGQRPLASVKDFITNLIANPEKALDFVKDGLTEVQKNSIEHFTRYAQGAFAAVTSQFIKQKDGISYKVPFQNFLDDQGDTDENVKTAILYAAYSYVIEASTRPAFNTDKGINGILLRQDEETVTPAERGLLHAVGQRQAMVVNSLGQRAFAALGVKAKATAPIDLQIKLEIELGQHALQFLLDRGILTKDTVDGKVMATMMGREVNERTQDQVFIKLARNKDNKPVPAAQNIIDASKGTKGIIDKLFSVQSRVRPATYTPMPYDGQENTPTAMKTILEQANQQPWRINEAMAKLLGGLDEEIVIQLAGGIPVDNFVHKANKKGQEAKNDGLRRELHNIMEFVYNTLVPEKGIATPVFLRHEMWDQGRVGIANTSTNPQASKIHRAMMYQPSWETIIDMQDDTVMNRFRAVIAAGLGISIDKQANTTSFEQYKAALAQPEFKAAIAVLVKKLDNQELDAEDQQKLLAGVNKAGEGMQSLAALQALAEYSHAKGKGKTSFSTLVMGEVDGVNNGPMLAHLAFGAELNSVGLYDILNRGGFYDLDSTHSEYNVFRGSGNIDLYEKTAVYMDGVLDVLLAEGAVSQTVWDAVSRFTGQLTVDGKPTKDGRNLVKTPLTAMVYGSSTKSAINSMADAFIDGIYKSIEKSYAGKANAMTASEIVQSLRALGIPLASDLSIDDLMGMELSEQGIKQLKKHFADTVGKAVKQTMKDMYGTFMERIRALTMTAGAAFNLFDGVYQGMREERIQALLGKVGGITPTIKGAPMHDLSQEQEDALLGDLKDVMPMVNTPFSKQSNELENGMLVAKEKRLMATDADKLYQVQNYLQGAKPGKNGKRTFYQTDKGMVYRRINPGVAMAAKMVQSMDGAISQMAAMGGKVLNIHDAHGAGINDVLEAAQRLNKATWEVTTNYDPATEMRDAFMRTIEGLHKLMEEGKLTPLVQRRIAQKIHDHITEINKKIPNIEQHKSSVGYLHETLTEANKSAYEAAIVRLMTQENMAWVSQYAMEGGAYQVTDVDRQKIKDQWPNLAYGISVEQKVKFNAVNKLISDAILKIINDGDGQVTTPVAETQEEQEAPAEQPEPVAPTTSQWGELGKPAMDSDPALLAMFATDPAQTAGTIMEGLAAILEQAPDTNISGFRKQLLAQLKNLIPADMPIRLVTGETASTDVLEKGKDGSRGWYVSRDNAQAIYLLSPEFKFSGLTVETLLHELTHAAVARTVQRELDARKTNPRHKSDALDLVQELESLRGEVVQHLGGPDKLGSYAPAVENVQELIAWGMSNRSFQQNVLAKVSMTSTTTGNRLVSGFRQFIDTVVSILFRKSNKTEQEQRNNGMSVLVSNVAGLFNQAAQNKGTQGGTLVLNQAATIKDYTTADLYNALADNGRVSSGFDSKLRETLASIVTKLHGPFGAFKHSLMQGQAISEDEVFAQAMATGQAPFASASLAAGFPFSEKEAFVLEQVEATVRAALDGNEGFTSIAHKELTKLYDEVQAKVKVEDFHDGDWAQATPDEQGEAQELHDFIFKVEAGRNNRSDYLSRFAAMGLAHEGFNTLLQGMNTRIATGKAAPSILDRLAGIFNAILDRVTSLLTGTYAGQKADEKLTRLVTQLVGIEAKKRRTLMRRANAQASFLERSVSNLAEGAKAKLDVFSNQAFFKTSNNTVVKLMGNIISIYAKDRAEQVMETVQRTRNKMFTGQQGVLAAMLSEARGAHSATLIGHFLVRISKHLEGMRKNIITETGKVIMNSFVNKGEDLTDMDKRAISAVFLRTDMQSLLPHYGMQDLHDMLIDPAKLAKEIGQWEAKVEQGMNQAGKNTPSMFRRLYLNSAKALGYRLATGKVTVAHLWMNAGNIAKLVGTRYVHRVTEQEAQHYEALLDPLASLYAIQYSKGGYRKLAANVLAKELARTDGGNGVEMSLRTHDLLQQDSAERLFKGSDTLRMKGYVPEIYDPYITMVVADAEEGKKYEDQGYSKQAFNLPQDIANPGEPKHIYILRDGGMKPYLTGSMSYTGKQTKGSKVQDGTQTTAQQTVAIQARKVVEITTLAQDANFDPRVVKETYMAPVFNPAGDVVNYRYMMQERTKDKLLNRDNRPEKLLGAFAGSVFDKVESTRQNRRIVAAMHEQYKEEFGKTPEGYIKVASDSSDPEIREIYRMLPHDTKEAIREIWKKDYMMVRADLLDATFGYRKLSAADAFKREEEERNIAERMMVNLFTFTSGEKGALRVRQIEDVWQEVVKNTKSNLVVRSFSTLMGNFRSNVSALLLMGVSPIAMVRDHHVAYKGALSYRKDSAELFALQHQIDTGLVTAFGGNVQKAEDRIIKLRDHIARNPVKPLIDAGLMPTIVEDVDPDDDLYSYKSRLTQYTEGVTDKLHPLVRKASSEVLMMEGSTVYQTMSYATQISDFLARYTLYQHETTKRNPLSKEEALQYASEAFINYDLPSHRKVQYANDAGLVMFTKYYIRIQKILLRLYKESPGKVIAMVAAEKFLGNQPTILDSSMLTRFGNPLDVGAFNYPESLSQMATIKAATLPFD